MHTQMGVSGQTEEIIKEDSRKITVYTVEAKRFKLAEAKKYISNIGYVQKPSQIVRPEVDYYRYVGGKGHYGVGRVCLGRDGNLHFIS